jgi:exonuclease SbcD
VAHGSESESERPLAVGGAGQVARSRFDDADLVLLGHLHRPQPLYSGSILPYSFEEAQDAKSVVLIELGASGADIRRERIPLEPRRRMRIVEGAMDDLEAGKHGAGDEYVLARLSDQEPVLDAMARLRRLWPNLMHVERQRREVSEQNETRTRRRALDPENLFRAFWRETTGEEELPEGGDTELKEAVETVRAEDREEDAA